jgi:WD40 repeat protein
MIRFNSAPGLKRIEKVDSFTSPTNLKYSCFLYVENADSLKGDVLFVGCDCGQLVYSLFSNISSREELVSDEAKHSSTITCMMFSKNKLLSPNSEGLLFTGSRDRTIKIWNPSGPINKVFVQTCFEHTAAISALADGHDGTFLSSSTDGTVRVYAPQRARGSLLHPFFENVFTINTPGKWLSAMAINHHRLWTCYVGDSEGNIEMWRKGAGFVEVGTLTTTFGSNHLVKAKVLDNVHTLGVVQFYVIIEENFLVSLSFDGTVAVLDAHLGSLIFNISHAKYAVYTGVVWCPLESNLYLTDELGSLHIYNTFRETIISTIHLFTPETNKHLPGILSEHSDPILGPITMFR